MLLRDTTMHKCVQKTNLNMILKDMNSGKCPEERQTPSRRKEAWLWKQVAQKEIQGPKLATAAQVGYSWQELKTRRVWLTPTCTCCGPTNV